jgi:IS30 family transposase
METSYKRLSLGERIEIEKLLSQGKKSSEVASSLNRPQSALTLKLEIFLNHLSQKGYAR